MFQRFFTFFMIMAALTSNAHAYIDPGTGGMILQAIAAAVVGGMVTMRLYWAKIRAFFSPKNQKK